MFPYRDSYLQATRHPWACFLFLLPLLIAYEGGVLWLGQEHGQSFRNGADTWLRWVLETFGISAMYWPPALVGFIFIAWSWRRRYTRPLDPFSVCLGMAIESVVFALLLWILCQLQVPVLRSLNVNLSIPGEHASAVAQTIGFVGTGIYEELLFRLLLFSSLVWLLSRTGAPRFLSVGLAMIVSAALFAAAHHLGPYGELLDERVFLFRALAGLYFAALYQFRGLGVAVGAHACYDVLVGVAAG